jgi:hypothetical protein
MVVDGNENIKNMFVDSIENIKNMFVDGNENIKNIQLNQKAWLLMEMKISKTMFVD